MALTVALTHTTQYRYHRPTRLGPQVIRLRPAPHCRTPILGYSLSIEPNRHFINWQQDPFGNFLARVAVPDATGCFVTSVYLIADMAPINPFDFFLEEGAATWPFAYDAALAGDLLAYLARPPHEPLLESYLEGIDCSSRSTIDFICDVNRQVCRDVAYRVRMEPGVQSPQETLASRSGSCRDSGWLLVQLLRRVGLAARFVSGYLIELRGDPHPDVGSAGMAGDVAALHAWAEVYIPGAGWIGLDPTSGLLAGEGHIPLAATPSPISAAPITGTHDEIRVDFSVAMDIARIDAAPSQSAPYGEAEWDAILRAGNAVEARLQSDDVRLSMGGEPTFVALNDVGAPEWSVTALGPTKRVFADKLACGLMRRLASGGLLQHGTGKSYPGEPAPRWAFAIYWRKDGAPLWCNAELLAEEQPARGWGIEDANAFAKELASALGLVSASVMEAYEDVAHYLVAERKLPLALCPQANLDQAAERERLARVLDSGLGRPAGYVLPLLVVKPPGEPPSFCSERWAFRRERLFLLPGDAPMGLRLPLGSLPEISFLDYPDVLPTDPFAEPRSMPPGADLIGNGRARPIDSQPVRTALAVEPRGGHLCVFLPPLSDGEDYAALIAAIEVTAGKLAMPVRLEGYAPPFDPRISVIKVTPDPGVIEVNIHPALAWDQAVDTTTAVYEEARRVGLGADKFLLDGRHVSTGGGNHIVLGGITPADSPFLRRPDLLASIIAYWQNHPALSYLFAGLFIGPTSQAPRVDEARHEQLYELEIALRQIPEPGGAMAPWLVDRLFRNLLVDVTGNTHRAEICIDKLYAPEGSMGRLGLVELRAFEMPPNARMSLAQQLIVRALIAWFWKEPYRQRLVRWGTQLHDRFLLPFMLWSDLESIVADLNAGGLALDARWFKPHFEFRFPRWGSIEHAGVNLELRQALEPWLVLGETNGPGGPARPVDSSLERVQVLLTSANPDRYAVSCNGHAVPLASTERAGAKVAGVRFRAWRPIEGLHPGIGPHVPLTFTIVDTRSGCAIGGCRYHATHPGGRNYQSAPVNALEAEARRNARFERMGHSPASGPLKAGGVHPDAPMTLDLRCVF
jgi:uncharacterized protein (DUF2126 family)/transglutaminase-like putative cysteine protease